MKISNLYTAPTTDISTTSEGIRNEILIFSTLHNRPENCTIPLLKCDTFLSYPHRNSPTQESSKNNNHLISSQPIQFPLPISTTIHCCSNLSLPPLHSIPPSLSSPIPNPIPITRILCAISHKITQSSPNHSPLESFLSHEYSHNNTLHRSAWIRPPKWRNCFPRRGLKPSRMRTAWRR